MEKFDKIFDLLEKPSLSDAETASLNDAVKSDKEIDRLVKLFRNLQNKIPDSLHIDLELLASYVLYENGDEPEDKSVLLLAGKIREHLGKCNFCHVEYENLKQEFFQAGDFTNTVITDQPIKANFNASRERKSFLGRINFTRTFRYAFATVSTMALIYAGLFFYSESSIEPFKKGIFDAGQEEVYSTRGRTSITFQRGLDAVEHENYDAAIKYFQADIAENKNDQSIFYSYYVLGITQLHTAESSVAGLFKNFNHQIVKDAISSLQNSIQLNNSGSYQNINLDARYYLGRAYLLLEDFGNARENLSIVVTEKGRFYNEAKELIDTISNN